MTGLRISWILMIRAAMVLPWRTMNEGFEFLQREVEFEVFVQTTDDIDFRLVGKRVFRGFQRKGLVCPARQILLRLRLHRCVRAAPADYG
jgi:hypothetical protein